MAGTALNHLTTKIARGVPVEFWINVAPLTSGIITLATDGTPDATANPSAVNIGFTQDGVELTRTPTFEDLAVDQTTEPIMQAISTSDVHLKVKVLQIRDYANMVKLFPGTQALSGSGYSGMSDQLVQSFTLIPVCAIAPTPNDPTKFQVMLLYAAYNTAPLAVTLAKKYNVTPLDLRAQDAGRSDGRTFAFYETV